jgi:hypothetical protein
MLVNDKIDQKSRQAGNYYKPKNKQEREARRLVFDRYRAMRDDQRRKDAEEQWAMGDEMFMQWNEAAQNREEGDWRAHLTLPDGFAAIQTHMQETIERRSRPVLKPTESSDQALQMFGNAIINHNMDITGYDYQDYLAKQTAAIRGTAFVLDYWRTDKREIKDLDSVDDDGKLVYKKKIQTDFDDDYMEWVDNEFIFIDPGTSDQNLLRDMVYREIMDWHEFQRSYKLRPDFMNIDKVPRAGGVDDGQVKFFERTKDISDDEVEILHYYNRAIDAYYVLANNVLIRMTPLPFKHKELPLAIYTHYNVPGRIYGLGIPYVIFSLTEERKSLRNINLDRQHLNGDKMFLVNDLVDLDEEDARSRPHGLIEVNTNGLKLNEVIMPMEYGDTPVGYYKAEEMLLEDIRRAHGINDQLQGGDQGGTATEAAIRKETAQKRINLINLLAEMNTIIRIGKLKWSNIQFFYPSGRVEKITDPNEPIRKTRRIIRAEGRAFRIVTGDDNKTKIAYDDIDGESTFTLDKKMATFMGNEWDVSMDANSNVVLSKPLKQAKMTEMFNMLGLNPQLMAVIDPLKAVKRYITINEEDPRDWMRSNTMTDQEWRTLAMHENIVMARGQMLDPTANAPEPHTEVHLDYMNSPDYTDLIAQNPAIKEIFERHVFGENNANPNTQNTDEAAAGLPQEDPNNPLGGGVGGGAGAAGGGANPAPIDLQPSTVGGSDQRDTQQAQAGAA